MRLLGLLLAVLPLAACGSSDSKQAPEAPAGPAGDVREVSGAVKAKQGEAARDLAVGDTVEADEVIETGEGASVTIELRHNHARWSLAGGKSKQVSASAAWKAAARDPAAVADGERSTAAGRHAEREAHDTAASSKRGFQPAPPPTDEAPAATAEPTSADRDEAGGTGTAMALEEGKMQDRARRTVDGAVEALVARCGAPVTAVTVTLVIDAGGAVEEVVADGDADCVVDGLLATPFAADQAGTRTVTIRAARAGG